MSWPITMWNSWSPNSTYLHIRKKRKSLEEARYLKYPKENRGKLVEEASRQHLERIPGSLGDALLLFPPGRQEWEVGGLHQSTSMWKIIAMIKRNRAPWHRRSNTIKKVWPGDMSCPPQIILSVRTFLQTESKAKVKEWDQTTSWQNILWHAQSRIGFWLLLKNIFVSILTFILSGS